MTTHDRDLIEGPEMDALRGLRADVTGPSDVQVQAAWERAQGARSQGITKGKSQAGGRPWIIGTVAAVAASVVAVGIGVSALGGGQDQPAPPASSETTEPTNPNPTPFETGSVWEPADAKDKARLDRLAKENIHRQPDGTLRVDIPGTADGQALTRALNAEGIPIRLWAVFEKRGYWATAPEYPIDAEDGVDLSKTPSGTPYPMDRITAEYVDGPGSDLKSLTFDEIPTTPVDIQYAE